MVVDLQEVRAERDGRVVLRIPSLRLRDGRTTAILGPNGSGKTTLLRLIAGLDRPVGGRVLVGGGVVRPREHIAFVFQEEVVLRQSVRDNLELGLRLRGVAPDERQRRVADAADLLGIAHLLDRRADRLSGGEGRRVSLARALCLRAPLVLLDEPLAGLDERTYARLLDELPRLLAAFAATTVLVTHNRDEAVRLAEDLVILVDGRVHAAGEKGDVATNPRVAEVADVLGYAVLVAGGRQVAVPAGALCFGCGEVTFDVVVDHLLDLVDRREVIVTSGGTRLRVALPDGERPPSSGDRLKVHATRVYELTSPPHGAPAPVS